MKIEEKIEKYIGLNEKTELTAVQVDKDKEASTGIMAKMAREAAKLLKARNSYIVRTEDGSAVGIFAGNTPEDAIEKAKKAYPNLR